MTKSPPSAAAAAALKPASVLKTALLLVDIQSGLEVSSGYYGSERSTPDLESNVARLLARTREYNKKNASSNIAAISDDTTSNSNSNSPSPVFIVHVRHNSRDPSSPLHASKASNGPMPCAAEIEGEVVLTKNVNSGFVGTGLEEILRRQQVRQLLVCGITTAHCVSTTVRMASDLRVVHSNSNTNDDEDEDEDEGVVALIEDAAAAFNTDRFDAETVHAVNVACLKGEFAEIVTTADVLAVILGGK